MSMEVFRGRKFGGEPGAVPDDGHGDVFLVIDNYAGWSASMKCWWTRCDRLITEGPTFGIHVVGRRSAGPVSCARSARRGRVRVTGRATPG